MKRDNYKERIIDSMIEEYLKVFGAICIEGPNGAERLGLHLTIVVAKFFR